VAKHLGEFEQLLLFALLRLDDDAYGVRIRQEVEARTSRAISSGAVYTALSRLEARGFVQSRVGDTAPGRGGRRRKYYRLRPEGAAALQRCYDSMARMADGVIPALAARAAADPSRDE